jgi:hypothetical protein
LRVLAGTLDKGAGGVFSNQVHAQCQFKISGKRSWATATI